MSKRSERKLRERIEQELRDRENIQASYHNQDVDVYPSGHSTDPLGRFTSPTSGYRKLPTTQHRPPPPPRGKHPTLLQPKEICLALCHLSVGNYRYLVAFGVGEDNDAAMEQLGGELEKTFIPDSIGTRQVAVSAMPEEVWLNFHYVLCRFVEYERDKYKADELYARAWPEAAAELPTPEPQQQPSVPTRSKPNPLKGRRQ